MYTEKNTHNFLHTGSSHLWRVTESGSKTCPCTYYLVRLCFGVFTAVLPAYPAVLFSWQRRLSQCDYYGKIKNNRSSPIRDVNMASIWSMLQSTFLYVLFIGYVMPDCNDRMILFSIKSTTLVTWQWQHYWQITQTSTQTHVLLVIIIPVQISSRALGNLKKKYFSDVAVMAENL